MNGDTITTVQEKVIMVTPNPEKLHLANDKP
jgi:hypothetical protein